MTEEQNRQYVLGLLRERSHCETQGKTDRVEQIDAELARIGHQAAAPAKRAAKRVTKPAEER